jgi:WD40 repeat protein
MCASDDSDFQKPGGIKLWDLAANREREGFEGAKVSSLSVAFSPDGKTLASASPSSPAVNIWDVKSGKLITMIQDSAAVRHLAFSPDGKLLATGHGRTARRGDGSVQLWDTTTWQEVAFGQGHHSLTVSVAFSPDSRTLVTAGMDGLAVLWSIPAQEVARKDK